MIDGDDDNNYTYGHSTGKTNVMQRGITETPLKKVILNQSIFNRVFCCYISHIFRHFFYILYENVLLSEQLSGAMSMGNIAPEVDLFYGFVDDGRRSSITFDKENCLSFKRHFRKKTQYFLSLSLSLQSKMPMKTH